MSSKNENPASADALEEARVALAGGSAEEFFDPLAEFSVDRLVPTGPVTRVAMYSMEDVRQLREQAWDRAWGACYAALRRSQEGCMCAEKNELNLRTLKNPYSAEENGPEPSRESSTEPVNNEPIVKAPKEEEK